MQTLFYEAVAFFEIAKIMTFLKASSLIIFIFASWYNLPLNET